VLLSCGLFYHDSNVADYIASNGRKIGDLKRIWNDAAVA
jgi:hypothetical protein